MKPSCFAALLAALTVAACSEPPNPTEPESILPPTASVITASYDCSAQTDIPLGECQALVALYDATGGPTWTNETASDKPWFVGSPCGWYGVYCVGGTVHWLGLWGNNLVGSIPPELGDLIHLDALNLMDNPLSGPIPASLGDLTNLTRLALAYSQLSGPIPPELGNLSKLEVLGLQSNQLTGVIPTTFGNLTKLTQLHLYTNQLSGPIPTELGNLTKLAGLGLGGNQLSGPIPASMGNLTRLELVELQENELSGPIPGSLGNLSLLEQLWAYDNQLSGPIPSELGGLSSLTYLELHGNQLTGPIPASFGDLGNLTGLDLRENRLSGLVPIEVAELEASAPLDGNCWTWPGNHGLYVPDIEPYHTYAGADGSICELALISDFAQVAIDIKPGSDPNSVNCRASDEVISVAILTTDDFDAMTVEHTATLEGASETHVNRKTGEPRRHEEDVDEDGDIDLVLHFRLGDTGLTCDATEGTLIGVTFDGRGIAGSDAVRMIG